MSEYILKPPVGTVLNKHHPLARGLSGAWIFNEGRGLYAYDSSGYNGIGTRMGGATFNNGNAVFDGAVGSYIKVPDADLYSAGTGPITIVVFANPLSFVGEPAFFTKYTDTSPFDGEYYFSYLVTGKMFFQLLSVGLTYRIKITSSLVSFVNRWNHYVARFPGGTSKDDLDVFLNGVKDPAPTRVLNDTYTGTVNRASFVTIGGGFVDDPSYDSYFNGTIAYAYFYRRYLTDDEIRSIYRDPYQMFRPDPYELWTSYEAPSGNRRRRLIICGGSR
jgi:hypothetical protein